MPLKPTYEELAERVKELEARIESPSMLFGSIEITPEEFIDGLPEGIFVIDREGCFVYVNPVIERRSGIPLHKLRGLHLLDIVAPTSRDRVKSNLNRVEKGETLDPFEVTYNDINGDSVFVEINPKSLYKDGDLVGYLGISRDITDRKRMEEALKESESRYRTLFEMAPVGIGYSDINGRIIDRNEFLCRLSGYSDAEIIDHKNLDLYSNPEDRLTLSRRLRREGTIRGFETRQKRKNGEVFDVSISASNVTIGGEAAEMVVVEDITERKRVEKELRLSENRLNTAQRISHIGSWDRHLETGEKYWSDEQFRIFGYDPGEVVPTMDLLLEHIHPDDRGEFIRIRENEFYGRDSHRQEFRILRKDGAQRSVSTISTIERATDGKAVRYFGTLQDVTERKKMEAEIRKSYDELELRVVERTEELETKSKNLEELNTAMGVLIKKREEDKTELEEKILANFIELIIPYMEKLENTALNERQKAYLSILDANIQDIVSPFSRSLTQGVVKLTPSEIQVSDLIKHGKRTKEVAELLKLSVRTIESHRKNIRRKLGLNNKRANLRSHLMSIQ